MQATLFEIPRGSKVLCNKCCTVVDKCDLNKEWICRSCIKRKDTKYRRSRTRINAGVLLEPNRWAVWGMKKKCRGCSEILPFDAFYVTRANKNGISYLCRSCQLLACIKSRTTKKMLPFNLSPSDIAIPESCPVLGIPLQRRFGAGSGAQGKRTADDAPSVDRIDPAKGYVKGNVAVISWLANRIKSDCVDPDVFLKVAEYVRRYKPVG